MYPRKFQRCIHNGDPFAWRLLFAMNAGEAAKFLCGEFSYRIRPSMLNVSWRDKRWLWKHQGKSTHLTLIWWNASLIWKVEGIEKASVSFTPVSYDVAILETLKLKLMQQLLPKIKEAWHSTFMLPLVIDS